MSEKPDPSRSAHTTSSTTKKAEPMSAEGSVPDGILPTTIDVIQNLRLGNVPYAAAARRLEDVIWADPVLGNELRDVERKGLIDALLDRGRLQTPTQELIEAALSGEMPLGAPATDE